MAVALGIGSGVAIGSVGAASASLEELAVQFSRELLAHIREVDTQSTSAGSRFLDACRHFTARKSNVRTPDSWDQRVASHVLGETHENAAPR